MTQDEKELMEGQINCLEKAIDSYQSAIINLDAAESVILLAKGIENTARELGKLEGYFQNNKYTRWQNG